MTSATRIGAVPVAVLMAAFVIPQPVQADGRSPTPRASDLTNARMHERGLAQAGSGRAAPAAPRAASLPGGRALIGRSKAGLHTCSFDDTLLCGRITPPLDRGNPRFGTTDVRFVVAPHTGARSSPRGAIFATSGGPGNSITGGNGEMYPFRDYVLAPLRTGYDMVFIDQRGVGRSDPLRCPAWQHRVPTYRLARACAHRFGVTRNFYSSAAVADDTDAIRAALGYDEIIAMGGSYGGNDAVTYALRHPAHTALVVAGSPAMPLGPFDRFSATTPRAIPGVVARLCRRSADCHRAFPHPRHVISWMVHRVRHHPVVGVGYDADGQAHKLRVTESFLLWRLLQDSDFPFAIGEVTQAAAALEAGDAAPLLRLAASHDLGPADWDSGPVRDFSNAESLLRYCTDARFPWDVSAPSAVRHSQYAAALAAQPTRYGIFSRNAWAVPRPLGFFPDPCISARWRHVPEYPRGRTVDNVSTLVLSGDYDLIVPTAYAAHVTHLLTDSTLIEVKAAAHNPWFWRSCATRIVDHFIRSGKAENRCAGKRVPKYWEPGSFPMTVARVPRAKALPKDSSTPHDRRVATVAVWSLLDTMKQSFQASGTHGKGLRGGSTHWFIADAPPTPNAYHLHGVRFTRDVAVTGTGYWDWDNLLTGTFRVHAPGLGRAVLHVAGHFYTVDQRVIRVRGRIDGRRLRVTVPAY